MAFATITKDMATTNHAFMRSDLEYLFEEMPNMDLAEPQSHERQPP